VLFSFTSATLNLNPATASHRCNQTEGGSQETAKTRRKPSREESRDQEEQRRSQEEELKNDARGCWARNGKRRSQGERK
jgi:hypothetical protein